MPKPKSQKNIVLDPKPRIVWMFTSSQSEPRSLRERLVRVLDFFRRLNNNRNVRAQRWSLGRTKKWLLTIRRLHRKKRTTNALNRDYGGSLLGDPGEEYGGSKGNHVLEEKGWSERVSWSWKKTFGWFHWSSLKAKTITEVHQCKKNASNKWYSLE
jgi:hypothetical protein